ncbi:Alpha/Beta hydrolase protein [Triangularia verruculosa]|uniref:Alpha/Beta hydrolase protein n=1 Tax=Triangularia verruculosa TaxID=2587418 RepID=A0AAN7AYD3_9PEZI|nr:Alpha/Beta hydrolase protein [Triangularia verruculosa]
MFPDNPSLIQEGPQPTSLWAKPPTPLVLIHDGGGTVFSYYCLGDIDRQVHGISNPNYDSGESFPGGIPEMAALYVEYIKSIVPRGNLIIGGWSLGGLLSLEVASQLAVEGENKINLLGIVMVDSVCPLSWKNKGEGFMRVIKNGVAWGPHTKEETKQKVTRCFAESSRMVGEWELPKWEAQPVAPTPFDGIGRWEMMREIKPPPVILLRARERVPVPGEAEGTVSRVDVCRDDSMLGWGEYRKDLITKVVDIPGHHFNIFSNMANLDVATEEIRKACLELEGLHLKRFLSGRDSKR